MPYFPPPLAESLLVTSRDHTAGCRVPSLRHYFLSLAYHAVYHKGDSSGLPEHDGTPPLVKRAEHNYAGILRAMAGPLDVDASITLDDLDRYLAKKGWRPPRDMLTRLAA